MCAAAAPARRGTTVAANIAQLPRRAAAVERSQTGEYDVRPGSNGLRAHGRGAMRRTRIAGPTIVTMRGMRPIFGETPTSNIADRASSAEV
jgi:hypothetical protein